MKILILGGDGYCGWPTALHLSDAGHEVTIVDNLCRRRFDRDELGNTSLTPIRSLDERVEAWQELSGQTIAVELGDLLDTTSWPGWWPRPSPRRSSTTPSSARRPTR